MSRKKSRYRFSLVGVNIREVCRKYGIDLLESQREELSYPADDQPITKLEELEEFSAPTSQTISFLDQTKQTKRCCVSRINFDKPQKYKCYWDTDYIPSGVKPIGCPVRYIGPLTVKKYHSEISKDTYTIKEPITKQRVQELRESKDERFAIQENDYFLTDGVFCSFNCCMAYIQDREQSRDPAFSYSRLLLLRMYAELTQQTTSEIIPAPHWRELQEFGGHLSLKQFRQSFNSGINHYQGTLNCNGLAHLYEEQLRLA